MGSRGLTKRQRQVLEELFAAGGDEARALQKCRVPQWVYRRWLEEPVFLEELGLRMESVGRQTRVVLAKGGPVVAARLVELTQGEKEETARKACVDVLSMVAAGNVPARPGRSDGRGEEPAKPLPDDLAVAVADAVAQHERRRRLAKKTGPKGGATGTGEISQAAAGQATDEAQGGG